MSGSQNLFLADSSIECDDEEAWPEASKVAANTFTDSQQWCHPLHSQPISHSTPAIVIDTQVPTCTIEASQHNNPNLYANNVDGTYVAKVKLSESSSLLQVPIAYKNKVQNKTNVNHSPSCQVKDLTWDNELRKCDENNDPHKTVISVNEHHHNYEEATTSLENSTGTLSTKLFESTTRIEKASCDKNATAIQYASMSDNHGDSYVTKSLPLNINGTVAPIHYLKTLDHRWDNNLKLNDAITDQSRRSLRRNRSKCSTVRSRKDGASAVVLNSASSSCGSSIEASPRRNNTVLMPRYLFLRADESETTAEKCNLREGDCTAEVVTANQIGSVLHQSVGSILSEIQATVSFIQIYLIYFFNMVKHIML